MGLVMAPASTTIMTAVPAHQAGAGSAVNDTIREVGGALGVAVVGSLTAARLPQPPQRQARRPPRTRLRRARRHRFDRRCRRRRPGASAARAAARSCWRRTRASRRRWPSACGSRERSPSPLPLAAVAALPGRPASASTRRRRPTTALGRRGRRDLSARRGAGAVLGRRQDPGTRAADVGETEAMSDPSPSTTEMGFLSGHGDPWPPRARRDDVGGARGDPAATHRRGRPRRTRAALGAGPLPRCARDRAPHGPGTAARRGPRVRCTAFRCS